MKPNVIKATLPVLVAGAVFIAITTIGKDAKGSNFIHDMLQTIRSYGQHLIRLVEISLVCDNCKREGKGASCQHKMGEIPHWQTNDRYDDVKILMGGDNSTFSTELKGFKEDGGMKTIYDKDMLEAMRGPENILKESKLPAIDFVFMSFDPAAGSEESGIAIVSCIYPLMVGKAVIIGAEFQTCETLDIIEELVWKHVTSIKSMPEFASAKIVFIPESNLAWTGAHIFRYIRERLNFQIICMNEDRDREGQRTTNEMKKLYSEVFKSYLKSNKIVYYEKFFTNSEGFDANLMKNEIYTQLSNYSIIIQRGENNIYKKPTIIYTGKVGYGFDDLVIAIQMNLSLSNFFLYNEKYSRFRSS